MVIVLKLFIVLTIFTFICSFYFWLNRKFHQTYDELVYLKNKCIKISNKDEYNECVNELEHLSKKMFHKEHFKERQYIIHLLKTYKF